MMILRQFVRFTGFLVIDLLLHFILLLTVLMYYFEEDFLKVIPLHFS